MVSPIYIYIDGEQVQSPRRRLPGAELRALVSPPADHIWLDVADAQDRTVGADQLIELEEGDRFFTDRPRTVFLDKVAYRVRSAVISEADLRALPSPPLGPDRGIWKDIVDDVDDPLAPGELVRVADGDRFFSKLRPQREIHIVVNGRRKQIAGRTISYEQVVAIAFPDGPVGEMVTYSVVYSKAVAPKPEGTLAEGGQVTVKEGTRFNVTPTDKS
ncbi:hypothetical protein QE375_002901 [Microbacterium foliorum]|uniref:Multi-ubiquitin domain-containing protein n=1 Tax=Microbacterium foliorum TaxID=104336 RepID=A0ABU1HTH9_9MICO|nr:multiubiquitin domain-containing protein [Microbacterium foliorum]MDR6143347.1 hypothetical protein [Microbacterium foliorum]